MLCKNRAVLSCVFLLSFPPAFADTAALPLHAALQQHDLQQYEGFFQKADNADACIRLSVKNGALEGKQLWDDRTYELVRKADGAFTTKNDEYALRFVKNDSGAVVKVVIGRTEWVKVKSYQPRTAVQLPAEQLQRLAGKYRFQRDPGSLLQISVSGDHLVLRQLWDDKEITLWPQAELDFFSKERSFPAAFIKDAAGKIVRLRCFESDLWDKIE